MRQPPIQALAGLDAPGLLPRNDWAILLAAGEGSRVRSFTMDAEGVSVPKQFYAVAGDESMLTWTLRRAARVVTSERIVTIVAAQHEHFWRSQLVEYEAQNVVVQPANRGTAPGILLPALEVLARDPQATLVIMPTDHFVAREGVVEAALHAALDAAQHHGVVLLGMEPTDHDEDYGWIVPGRPVLDAGCAAPVARFVEKPERKIAEELHRAGALLNSMIIVARGTELLALYRRTVPWLLDELERVRRSGKPLAVEIKRLYALLPHCDFSREVLERGAETLSVIRVPDCGWSDLGVPARLTSFVERRVVAEPQA